MGDGRVLLHTNRADRTHRNTHKTTRNTLQSINRQEDTNDAEHRLTGDDTGRLPMVSTPIGTTHLLRYCAALNPSQGTQQTQRLDGGWNDGRLEWLE